MCVCLLWRQLYTFLYTYLESVKKVKENLSLVRYGCLFTIFCLNLTIQQCWFAAFSDVSLSATLPMFFLFEKYTSKHTRSYWSDTVYPWSYNTWLNWGWCSDWSQQLLWTSSVAGVLMVCRAWPCFLRQLACRGRWRLWCREERFGMLQHAVSFHSWCCLQVFATFLPNLICCVLIASPILKWNLNKTLKDRETVFDLFRPR